MIWNITKVRSLCVAFLFPKKNLTILKKLSIIKFLETKSYSIPCRCSGNYIITEQDLETGATVTECTNCSLNIHVLYETIDE